MQYAFNLGQCDDLTWIHDRLCEHFGQPPAFWQKRPIDQLVRSLIAGRTRDAVSDSTFADLLETCHGNWNRIADMPVADVRFLLRNVSFPETKAEHLKATLHAIRTIQPDFTLDFLTRFSELEAHHWLERHAGIGPKVAAAILNFSTLERQSFVADTHVLRVFVRYGLVERPDARLACQLVTGARPDWTPADLRAFHYWVKRLGQTLCTAASTDCPGCPIGEHCRGRSDRKTARYSAENELNSPASKSTRMSAYSTLSSGRAVV